MRIHRVSKGLAFENRLQVLLGQLEGTCDARVDVVTLLKVNVLKEIAANRPGRNGVAIHIDASELGNGTLNWHQSLAEVLVNGEFYLGHRHKNDSVRRLPVHILGSPMGTNGIIRKPLGHRVVISDTSHPPSSRGRETAVQEVGRVGNEKCRKLC